MPSIVQSLLIAASAEKIYDALTCQQGLSAWWTPDTEATATAGSMARFHFGPDYFKEMRITELKPCEFVQWECLKGDDQWIGTAIQFSIVKGDRNLIIKQFPEMRGQLEQENSDEISLFIFRHDNWKDETLMFAECSYTWGRFLRSLKLFCETGKGQPWPEQHRIDRSERVPS